MIGGLIIQEKIKELIRRYSRYLERSQEKDSDFERGRALVYEDIIDDLNDLIDAHKTGLYLIDGEIISIDWRR